MILQSLYQLAMNEKLIADPDFEFKPVSWIVRLRPDGSLITIETNRSNLTEGQVDKRGKPAKAQWVGNEELIPIFPSGRTGIKPPPAFLVDMAKFLFGREPEQEGDPDRFKAYVERFRNRVIDCEKGTSEPHVHTVRLFLDRVLAGDFKEELPKEAGASDLYMFKVGDAIQGVHALPSVKAYWKSVRACSGTGESNGSDKRCIVTGKMIFGDAVLFPLIKGVPGGGTMGIGLLPFNSPPARTWWSYGLEGNDNAPVARDVAEAAAASLNRLLDRRPANGKGESLPLRRIQLSSDTVLVFWSPNAEAEIQNVLDSIPSLMNPPDDVTDVGNLFQSVRSGILKPLKKPGTFYAMTLTGTTGRVAMRDWLECTVAEVQKNLQQHFDALNCVRNTPPIKGRPARAVLALDEVMSSLAAPGRDAQVPAVLAADFIRAGLRGTPYPRAILQRALLRERAEASNNDWDDYIRRDSRAALIKAVLIRDPEFHTALEKAMDEQRTEPGFWLGALLALLEDTQRLASGGVNASVKDKFYGAASATPAAVFPTMMSMYHKHIRKGSDAKPGAMVNREKRVDFIMTKLHDIPIHLDLKQQGLFVLGYHQQRFEFYNKEGKDLIKSSD